MRPPGYPLTLDLIGTGRLLVQLQTGLGLACFALLGWVVARIAGLVAMGLVSLSAAIHPWAGCILTESLTSSMLALTVAISLLLARARPPQMADSPLAAPLPRRGEAVRPPWGLALAWLACAL